MDNNTTINGIPTRILGKTGEQVTVIGLGGHTIGLVGDRQSGITIIRTAIDEGVNFLDNAWCYHEGESERIMGEALRGGYRDKVFLMTKNHGRDSMTFRNQLDESLRRLETDHIDLLQFHNILSEDDPDRIFSGGAIDAAVEARKMGKIRFIGFSGHHWPHLFRRMLEKEFPWDTVQHPVNPLDARYRSFSRNVLPILKERKIGAIAMKIFSGGHLFKTGITATEAIGYALSQPVDTLVLGIDSLEFLKENLEIVRKWQPITNEEQVMIEERVLRWSLGGKLEKYKTEIEY